MSGANPFLQEFLQMRKTFQASGPAPADVLPKSKKGRKPKEQFTKEQKVAKPGIQHIIEEKPKKKVLIEYLQNRANELTLQKIS